MKIADVTEPQSLHDSMLSDVEREYTNDFFQKIAESINEQWDWFIDHWPTESIQETTLTFLDEYELYLTKYGTRGSYDSPNTIITNVHLRKLENTASVIFHEMIHLSIESLVLKYQTPHWYKERAVDLLYKKLLPEKAFEQNLPKEALQVDPIFNRDYGDIEMIIKNISTLPT